MPLTEEAATDVQNLTWALADDVITTDDVKRLETMLLGDADARKLYVECMQLQADLHLFFNPKLAEIKLPIPVAAPATTPVLKNLPTTGSGSNAAPNGICE